MNCNDCDRLPHCRKTLDLEEFLFDMTIIISTKEVKEFLAKHCDDFKESVSQDPDQLKLDV